MDEREIGVSSDPVGTPQGDDTRKQDHKPWNAWVRKRASNFKERCRRAYSYLKRPYDYLKKPKHLIQTATLVFVGLYTLYSCQQKDAAIRSADEGRDQLDEIRLSGRAWIGPVNAGFSGTPTLRQDQTVQIAMINAGKEPAIDLVESASVVLVGPDLNTPDNQSLISGHTTDCMTTSPPTEGGDVIFPSVLIINRSFVTQGGKTQNVVVDGTWMSQELFNKKASLLLFSCFVYRTLGQVHHTSVCYYWAGDMTTKDNWNYCAFGGNSAD